MLIKPYIEQFICNLDRSYENIISFELTILPNILFLGCYLTLRDSQYYDSAIFGYIQGILKRDCSKIVFIVGDLNSRVGVPTDLSFGEEILVYNGCEDLTLNENGKCLLQMCRESNIAVVNNLNYNDEHFESALSFRKKDTWISEPDLLLTSKFGISLIDSFRMIQKHNGKHLYSDHALLEFVINTERVNISTELLKYRANDLGMSVYETRPITIGKTLSLSQCNLEVVMKYFLENNPPVIAGNEHIDTVVDSFFNIVRDVMKENKAPRVEVVQEWGNQAKWTRLIDNNDLRTIWKAIGWNGSIDETSSVAPTDG